MDRFSYELLSLLKDQFNSAAAKEVRYKSAESGPGGSPRQFYLARQEDNLYPPMSQRTRDAYRSGDGGELGGKMRALHSSSAMTYNLLGNGPVNVRPNPWFGAGRYEVTFEAKLSTLKSSSRKANLDALLYNAEAREAVLCEMKMTEWLFGRPGGLKDAYFHRENYSHPEAAERLIPIARALCGPEPDSKNVHPPLLTQYDACQMFKHILACYNGCLGELPPVRKLTLVNCVWDLPCPDRLTGKSRETCLRRGETERREFGRFTALCAPVSDLFREIGVDFSLKKLSAADLLSALEKTPAELAWLRRYTF